jgi:hypothetical protein
LFFSFRDTFFLLLFPGYRKSSQDSLDDFVSPKGARCKGPKKAVAVADDSRQPTMNQLLSKTASPALTTSGEDDAKVKDKEASEEEEEEEVEHWKHQLSQATMGKKM